MAACRVGGLDWEIVRFERLAVSWRQIEQWVIRIAHSREKTVCFAVTESFRKRQWPQALQGTHML
jgi:hypothetical protein